MLKDIKFKKQLNFLILFITIGVFSLSAFFIVIYLERFFFFDKLIYYKSTKYGYFIPNKNNKLTDFGKRTTDLISFNNYEIKNTKNPNQFNIALIGDSYLWGMGVPYNETVTARLKKHFSKNKDINIINISYPGNSLLDYLNIYQNLENRNQKINLYIFFLVDNDLLASRQKNEYQGLEKQIISECEQNTGQNIISTAPFWQKKYSVASDLTHEATKLSWKMNSHLCLGEKTIKLLPDNAIYFLTDDFGKQYDNFRIYEELLRQNNKNVISSRSSINDSQYKKYWADPEKYLRVSKIEIHPSSMAHQIYSTIISSIIEDKYSK